MFSLPFMVPHVLDPQLNVIFWVIDDLPLGEKFLFIREGIGAGGNTALAPCLLLLCA